MVVVGGKKEFWLKAYELDTVNMFPNENFPLSYSLYNC